MNRSREIKSGILAIAAILLFIFGYNFLKGSNLLNSKRIYYVLYENVDGLAPSAPVTINGLQVGRVEQINFANDQGGLVVTFSVDSDFQFSKESMVEIYSSGFISGNNLGIKPKYDINNIAVSGDTLTGTITKGMLDGLMDTFSPLEGSIRLTLARLDTVLYDIDDILNDETRNDLKSAIASLDATMASVKGITANTKSLLADNRESLDRTIQNLDTTTANFARISDSLAQIETAKIAADLQAVVDDFKQITTRIESGEGTVGKLLYDEALYDNLAGASKELEELLADFKENPKRYVHFSVFGKKAQPYEAEPQNPPE
ncbi:MlaD family protein [Aureitalea marina]|uniref:ABC transporter substrate-binding protein n=1 Tax=Aureitalea marina TaxID=930804 RepID=A0A2S7KNZ8_9FLAO|nr:MlaD family protein [Aureitalea marina]PQB04354.1 ABC transporter substrate-binding protein [Aureitalea marina]